MKIFTKTLAMLLLGFILPTVPASAHESANGDYLPGFFGHPLLATPTNSYNNTCFKAQQGAFTIDLGSGTNALDNMTDGNLETSAGGFNVASIDGLLYGEIVKVVTDFEKTPEATPFTPGTSLGFALSTESNNFSLLNLTVSQLMVVNLLDRNGKIVASQVSQGDSDFNVLDLNLIGVSVDGMLKVTATIPEGLESEIYGISLSSGGVDVKVLNSLRLNYAFVDDYEIVPIIKKYYPDATGSVKGMATGGKKLVNNNLNDGAATAILTIGGSYYTVMANAKDEHGNLQPFPHGVEAGWVMSSGTVLSLEAGGAIQILGITMDGNEEVIATNVSVVGLNLLGGGDTVIPFMTPTDPDKDYIGFKLNRINVLDLDLGATLVNYAYIKVPTSLVPVPNLPFDARIEVVPGSKADNNDASGVNNDGVFNANVNAGENPNIRNNYKNTIYILNDGEKPLTIPEKVEESNGCWKYFTGGGTGNDLVADNFNGYTLNNPNLRTQIGVARTEILQNGNTGETKDVGYYNLVYTLDVSQAIGNTDLGGNVLKDYKLYYRYKGYSITKKWRELPFDETTGVIDLSKIDLSELNDDEGDLQQDIKLKGNEGDPNNVVGYEYTLYYIKEWQAHNGVSDGGVPLDNSVVMIPTFSPEWEMAGTINNITEANDIITSDNQSFTAETRSSGPWGTDVVGTDKYRHYVSFTVPNENDDKTDIESVVLYRYYTYKSGAITYLAREVVDTYTWSLDENGRRKWSTANGNLKGQVNINGTSKIVAFIKDDDTQDMYGLQTTLSLNDKYVTELAGRLGVDAQTITNNRNLDYGWYWTGAGYYYTPDLYVIDMTCATNGGVTSFRTEWGLSLNTCKDIHLAQNESPWFDRNGDAIYNVDILYNQWSNISLSGKGTRVKRRIETTDRNFAYTDQNVVLNNGADGTGNTFEVANFESKYDITNDETGDHVAVMETTYPNDYIWNETVYAVQTRAYIPVVPDGFTTSGLSDDVQTYLVVDGMDSRTVGESTTTGVEDIVSDANNDVQAIYYNIQGVRVNEPQKGQIYIVRRGDNITKELIK